jgi:TRAP-type C4-dicarboxylate transport system substrate-binding protein
LKRREFLAAIPALAGPIGLSASHARASEGVEPLVNLRMATLAPNGSSWMRVFSAWKNTVEKRTEGRIRLTFYAGGAAGDERDVVRKMREGQLDGAALTTVGLGQIVRPVLVLQAPGACHSYAEVDAVRTQLASEFDQEFERAGYKLLGWGDAGLTRLFSNRPILTPDDMRQTRMWSWKDDPNWQSVLTACNVTGVPLGLPEVYPALRTNRINAFPGTAIAAVAFQWHTKATHVTRDARGVVIGAVVVDKKKFDAIPADLKAVFLETAEQANQLLSRTIRHDDQAALDAIVARGVQLVDIAAEQHAAWEAVNLKARESLAGKLYPVDFLRRVEAIAREARRA